MEQSSLKRKARREATRSPEPHTPEARAINGQDLQKGDGPATPKATGQTHSQPNTPNDYALTTPPPLNKTPLANDAMEEDEGMKWDGVLREDSEEISGSRNRATPITARERLGMSMGTGGTPQLNRGTPLVMGAGTGQETRREQHEGIPNAQENDNPPYTTYDHTMLTPIPQGGYPVVHGWTSLNVFAGTALDVVHEWKTDGVCKCFIYPLDAGTETDRSATADKFQTSIARLFGTDEIQVGEPIGPHNGASRPPWLYVTAAPLHVAQALVQRGVWSTSYATFLAIPFSPQLSSYAFTLTNFRVPASEEGGRRIANLVCNAMKESQKLMDFLSQNFPPDENDFEAITPAEILFHHADTVRAYPLTIARPKNAGSEVLWNIHIQVISQDIATHNEWVTLLKGLRYYIPYMSVGSTRTFKCTRCKSMDHPAGLCPFPKIPGWLGPKGEAPQRHTEDAKLGQNNMSIRGSSFRGRGRGGPI